MRGGADRRFDELKGTLRGIIRDRCVRRGESKNIPKPIRRVIHGSCAFSFYSISKPWTRLRAHTRPNYAATPHTIPLAIRMWAFV